MQAETGNGVPDPALAAWLVRVLAPGGRVDRWTRLPGATSSLVDAALVVDSTGRGRQVVVRRYAGTWREAGPLLVRSEAAVLTAVGEALRWPAVPEVLAVDPEGEEAGWPTIVSTLVPGTPVVAPQAGLDAPTLVHGLADVHRAVADAKVEVGGLPAYAPWTSPPLTVPTYSEERRAWERAIEELEALSGGIPPSREPWAFVHRDLHPGNVLWDGNRVSGLVDWLNGCAGPLETDVARCRVNLATSVDLATADAFLEAVADLVPDYDPRWDLLVCAEYLPDPVILTTLAEQGAPVDERRARAAVDGVLLAALARLGCR
jgi:aminoglycoside phosphotransferase (APT) family kinase protein